MNGLSQIVDQTEAERLATGFVFTEGPLWHPDGFYYFVDVRASKFYRIRPGGAAELLRENTGEGNGTTFDPQGRLILCEGGNRRLTRWPADGKFASSDVLIDRFEGKRLSRPNDVLCKSDGSVYFTNPGLPCRSPTASSILRRYTASILTVRSVMSPISNTRTGSPSRPTSALSMSRTPGLRCTSTRSNWTAPAMWCAAAS